MAINYSKCFVSYPTIIPPVYLSQLSITFGGSNGDTEVLFNPDKFYGGYNPHPDWMNDEGTEGWFHYGGYTAASSERAKKCEIDSNTFVDGVGSSPEVENSMYSKAKGPFEPEVLRSRASV